MPWWEMEICLELESLMLGIECDWAMDVPAIKIKLFKSTAP